MIVLGVDPGYKNLGLAIVDTVTYELLHSETFSVGSSSSILTFPERLYPKLQELHETYGFTHIATETPPFIEYNIKTTTALWASSMVMKTWAFVQGVHFDHRAPMVLKRGAVAAMGETWVPRMRVPKSYIKKAILKLLGKAGKTNHEDDAALVAVIVHGDIYGGAP